MRKLESDTRMRYLLGNNPMGEILKLISEKFNRINRIRIWRTKRGL